MVLPAHGMRTLAAQAIRLSGSARRLFGQRAPLSVSAAPPLVQAFAPIMSADTAVLRNSLLAGDRAALARAITLMESRRPDKRDQGQALLFDVANSNRFRSSSLGSSERRHVKRFALRSRDHLALASPLLLRRLARISPPSTNAWLF
eukprot:m.559733 g.559733  ORF g.559733 m.559733 type:complete len:147 (+) comp57778_c0_seq1:136-576(+)